MYASGVWGTEDGDAGIEEVEFGVVVAVGAGDEEEEEELLVVVPVVLEGGNHCSRRWPM